MAEMELDLDVLSQGPARPAGTRFVPRGSKAQPKPKIKAEPLAPQLKSSVELEPNPSLSVKKDQSQAAGLDFTQNDAVGMDVDSKEEMKLEEPLIDDDRDQVVNEIDVYFSPNIDANTKLYVLQYPLRPLWRPYELDERCKEVRVKADSGEVEIDLSIDVDNEQNYDNNADPKLKITKQTLSSSWTPPAQAAYAVGVLTGNELHLNPVHAVVQLRPSMEHLKPGGSLKKSAGNTKGEGIVKVEEVKVEKSGSSAKQGKLHGELSEQTKACEQWFPLKYFGARSDTSASCLHKMMEKEDSHIPFLMCPHDYINTLCPGTSNNNVKVRGLSIRALHSLPLDERFKVWFREPGHEVNRFVALKHLALEESDEEILGVILKYARLVQGNWVAKSSLVYGKDTGLEVVARDNVLAHFRKNLVFSSKQLPQKPDFRNATKDVLNVFARSSGHDWKFDTPRDVEFLKFLKLYPSIEVQQEEAWKKLEEQIDSLLSKNRSKTAPKSTGPVPGKSSHKAAGSKVQNGTMLRSMPGETREFMLIAIKSILRQGGLRLSQICEFLRNQAVRLRSQTVSESQLSVREADAVADAVNSFPDEFQKVTNEVAVNIHGVFVLRSSPDNSQHDALRKIVIDLLIGQGPDAKVKKGSVAEAAKLQLGRDMNNEEFRKVITELCVPQNSAWVLKAGDGNPNILK